MTEVFVRRTDTENGGTGIILHAGKNLKTGESDFKNKFGAPTSIEKDLLLIASAVFAADRCIARGEREELNRQITLSIPVVNTALLIPIKNLLNDLLRTLSHDYWRVEFRQSPGSADSDSAIAQNQGNTLCSRAV